MALNFNIRFFEIINENLPIKGDEVVENVANSWKSRWNMRSDFIEQLPYNADVAVSLACSDDAAPVLGRQVVEVCRHEDSCAAGDNRAEKLVVGLAFAEHTVESVEPVDSQQTEIYFMSF